MQLRSYQLDAVDRLRASVAAGNRRVICQAVTGAGKTVIAGQIIRAAAEKGSRVLFLAHARELIGQCSRKLDAFDICHGIIMAGHMGDSWYAVQVASKDTLLARAVRTNKIDLPPADLVVVDECHRSLSKWYKHLLDQYPRAVILGLTATPARGDGRGLGDLFTDMVCACPMSQLITENYLVKAKCYAPYTPDLTGVKTQGGDYVRGQLAKRMDKPTLVGDLVAHWKAFAGGRSTITFGTDVRHSLHIRDEYLRAGIRAEHLDANTPMEERDGILGRLNDGTTQVVCNVFVLTEGFDCPRVSCIQDAGPTKSLVRAIQKWGRGLRAFPGKEDCVILDHAGNIVRHGFPDEDREWILAPTEKTQDREEKLREEGQRKAPIVCPACSAIFEGRPDCPNCGHVLQRKGREVKDRKDGKLVELNRLDGPALTSEQKERLWTKALAIAANRNGTPRMAAAIYRRDSGGEWPPNTFRLVPRGVQWDQKVKELYPQFVRVNKV